MGLPQGGHFRSLRNFRLTFSLRAFARSAFAKAFSGTLAAMRPHVLGHIFAPFALQKLRLGHLRAKAVLSQRILLLVVNPAFVKASVYRHHGDV